MYRFTTFQNGIDIEKFSQKTDYDATVARFPMYNRKTFIFIGRLGQEKSVDRLINGMSVAMRRDKDIRPASHRGRSGSEGV